MVAAIIKSTVLGLTLGAALACAAEPGPTRPVQAELSHLSTDIDTAAAPACRGPSSAKIYDDTATVSACVSDRPTRS
jgi:hypothetical protein